jgi:hypothetical protein
MFGVAPDLSPLYIHSSLNTIKHTPAHFFRIFHLFGVEMALALLYGDCRCVQIGEFGVQRCFFISLHFSQERRKLAARAIRR